MDEFLSVLWEKYRNIRGSGMNKIIKAWRMYKALSKIDQYEFTTFTVTAPGIYMAILVYKKKTWIMEIIRAA